MALPAPSSAYRAYGYWANKGADYKHEGLILQTSKAVMLARFYLDGMLGFTGPDGTDGYVGFVNVGSANYARHAPVRRGVGGAWDGVLLLDGGANSFGNVVSQLVVSPAMDNFIIRGNFKTAFYVKNTVIGCRYRISLYGNDIWGPWFEDSELDASGQALDASFSVDIKLWAVIHTRVGFQSKVQYQAYIKNSEGPYYIPTLAEAKVTLIPLKLRSQIGGAVTTYFVNTPYFVKASDGASSFAAMSLYRETGTSYIPHAGTFYHETNNNIRYVFGDAVVGSVSGMSYLLEIIDSTAPSITYSPVTFAGYSATQTGACRDATLGREVTVYVKNNANDPTDPDRGKFFVQSTGGAYAPNGYYIDYDGVYFRIGIMTNGVRVPTGTNCPI